MNEFEGHLGKQAGIGANTAVSLLLWDCRSHPCLSDQGNIAQIEGQKDLAKTLYANGKTVQHDLQGRSAHHNKEEPKLPAGHKGHGGHANEGGHGGHGGKHHPKIQDIEVDGHAGVGHDRHGHKAKEGTHHRSEHKRFHGDHEYTLADVPVGDKTVNDGGVDVELGEGKHHHSRNHEHGYSLANAVGKDYSLNDLKVETKVGQEKHHHPRGDHEYTIGHIPAKDKTLNDLDIDVNLGHGQFHHPEKRYEQHDYTIGPIGGLVVDLNIGHGIHHRSHDEEYDLVHIPGKDHSVNNLDLTVDVGHGAFHHPRGHDEEYTLTHAPVSDKALNDINLDINLGHEKHHHSRQIKDEAEESEEQYKGYDARDIVSNPNKKNAQHHGNLLDADVKLDVNGHRFPAILGRAHSELNKDIKEAEHGVYPAKDISKAGHTIEKQTHAVQAGGDGAETVSVFLCLLMWIYANATGGKRSG